MNKKKQSIVALSILMLCAITGSANAEQLDSYNFPDVVVEGKINKDQFGNVITEQSYYRTGGDVNVVDQKTIEKRHFNQVSDALKSLPGVQVKSGGYRGGEYGYTQTHTVVSINGDDRVVVLVDGRRYDNASGGPVASNSGSGSKAMVDINQIMSMDNIEKIEVIKGPGASFYGADATGGVINIITKKGKKIGQGSIDLSTGSWKRHNYRINYSGSTDEGRLKYFLAASREMGGNSKYKDGLSGNNYTFYGTGYKDNAINARIDYDFDDTHSLNFSFNHMDAMDDYPLTAPDHKYFNEYDWNRIKDDYFHNDKYGDPSNPGYRNLWYMWAVTGAYNAYNKNNMDLSYKFAEENGMESFVRIYNQSERYWGTFGAGDREDSPVPDTPEWWQWANDNYRSRSYKSWFHRQQNKGAQVQLGKQIGKHDVLTTWTYDKSDYYKWDRKKDKESNVERKSVNGYLQDKIHITEKWDVTPSLRYQHYASFGKTSVDGDKSTSGDSQTYITPSLNTQYAFDDTSSAYIGWSKVRRPLRVGDYTRTNSDGPANLEDEKGDAITIGFRKDFSENTSMAINYDYTKMSNAVARYSVWDKPSEDFKLKYVNAEETKKSINLSLQQKFGKHTTLNLNYSHATDDWSAKNGMTLDPDLSWANGNVNSVINKLRPANTYTADLSYENKDFYAALTANYYTGCSTEAYTDNRFLVMDLSLNYDIKKDISLYASVTNLTNEAWQNVYTNYLGMGAWPQPGRCFMVGMKYKF